MEILEKAIKDILQHYNELNLTIYVTHTKETEKGTTLIREIRRSSEHFNIKDNYEKVEDSKTLDFLNSEKANLMRHAYIMTKAALYDNLRRNKIQKEDYDKLMQEIEVQKDIKQVYDINSANHYNAYDWIMKVLFVLDIVTDAKIFLFQGVFDKNGTLIGSKKVTEEADTAFARKMKNENNAQSN